MSIFEAALLCGAVAAALLSWGNWRAWAWLALGAADYIVTSAYYAAGLPLHPFFTAMIDALVCIAIYSVGKRYGAQRWELGVYTAFWLSVIVGFARLSGNVSVTLYPLLLELTNWLAILSIAGAGIIRLAHVGLDVGGGYPDRGRVHRAFRAAFAPARLDPFWFAGRPQT